MNWWTVIYQNGQTRRVLAQSAQLARVVGAVVNSPVLEVLAW